MTQVPKKQHPAYCDLMFERAFALLSEQGIARDIAIGRALHIVGAHLVEHRGEEAASALLATLASGIHAGRYADDGEFEDVPRKPRH